MKKPDHAYTDKALAGVDAAMASEERAFAFTPIDAADLVSADMAEPTFIVEPWIAEGVTLVVGRPKIGKTTLMRQLVLTVNTGRTFLGEQCNRAPTLFLCLEEGERMMRMKLQRAGVPVADLRGISLMFEWPQGADGVNALGHWLSHTVPRGERALVVIDSLTRFRTMPDQRANAFLQDYYAVCGLTELCKEHPGLAVVLLHHTRKAVDVDDPINCISGTLGLPAVIENFHILLKQGGKYRLHVGGRTWMREVTDFELERSEDASGWLLRGEWEGEIETLPPKQAAVYGALCKGAKTRKVIAEAVGMPENNVSKVITSLEDRGLVRRLANGYEIVRH